MGIRRQGPTSKLTHPTLRGLLAALALTAAVLALPSRAGVVQATQTWTSPHRVFVARTLELPKGEAEKSFDFTIHADYPDRVVLVVSRHAAISVRALSADGYMQIRGATRPWTSGCRTDGSRDVCAQDEEWCPLVQGRWRATVTKTSEPAAVARVLLVFARELNPK